MKRIFTVGFPRQHLRRDDFDQHRLSSGALAYARQAADWSGQWVKKSG